MINNYFNNVIIQILEIFLSIFSIIIPLLICVAYLTLIERKILACIQRRFGPDQVGYIGLLQPISDASKLIFKETILPIISDKILFISAPILSFILSFIIQIIVPFSDFGAIIEFDLGILYIFAISSLNVYSIIISGYSSSSRYAFLGSLRSAAQMISYEISFGLILISVLLCTNSLNLIDIIEYQIEIVQFAVPFFPLAIIFFISTLAETNRSPFDLPEAEAELVAGYNVEYSSIGFALFFISEYFNIIFMSTLNVIIFQGGYDSIFQYNFHINSFFFIIKVIFFIFLFIYVRGILPRYRYDQLMFLGQKVFLPISLAYIFFISFFINFI